MKTATTQHECEHMDQGQGACLRCKGKVPFLSGETDKALAPLMMLLTPNRQYLVKDYTPFSVRYPR